MLLTETKPIITKPVTKATFDYFQQKYNQKGIEYGDDESELESKLAKFGWERLGAGVYSSVYGNPKKSYVLKINKRPDEGYEKYVKLIKKYRNKYFPRITDMKVLKIGGKKYYVYLIERLYKISSQTAIKYSILFDDVICYFYDKPKGKVSNLFINNELKQLLSNNPELVNALRILGTAKNYNLDLHGENIMKRKDGTIVITDPYS